jgi:hypothetical protein
MDQLNQDSLNRERDTSHEADLRESETEREWTDGQNQGEVAADEAYHKSIREQLKRHKNRRTLDQSRRLWETEFNLRRMSEQELADFVDDLDPMVKGKLWAALENNRHD